MPSVIGLLISFLCGFGLSEDYKTKSIQIGMRQGSTLLISERLIRIKRQTD